jgi:RNA polymerase sigma-70 factor (ECF subfamily)
VELAALLELCRQGDELAWEALVRQYQSRIYGLSLGYLGNPEEARDLAQEIFVRVYRHLDSCTDPEGFVPWMIRIARNACVDQLRRRKARPPASDIPVDQMFDLPASGPDPEQASQQAARRELLYRALQQLSPINREIILLKEIQGMSLEDLSELLDVPLGTIKSRSNRARVELAKAVLHMTGGAALPELEA